jgi:hypothetical protein
MRAFRLALVGILAVGLAGCNVDFGFACRRVAGSYCLERWEDGATYYLFDRSTRMEGGGGAIDGVVQRMAWTHDLILVERKALFGGDPNGWMVIDVAQRKVRGPITAAEAQALLARQGIQPASAADAWRRLGR